MKIKEFPLPVVHLNGTGKETLIKTYSDALDSLNISIEKFLSLEFHPRDYYVISDSAYSEARSARAEIYRKLVDAKEYLSKHVESLTNK